MAKYDEYGNGIESNSRHSQFTFWTLVDLAQFTATQLQMVLDEQLYCKDCMVIPATTDAGMCTGCEAAYMNAVCDTLAQRYTEQGQIEKGLYI